MNWAGLKRNDPKVGNNTLSELNDRLGKNFKEIAAVIQKSKL